MSATLYIDYCVRWCNDIPQNFGSSCPSFLHLLHRGAPTLSSWQQHGLKLSPWWLQTHCPVLSSILRLVSPFLQSISCAKKKKSNIKASLLYTLLTYFRNKAVECACSLLNGCASGLAKGASLRGEALKWCLYLFRVRLVHICTALDCLRYLHRVYLH